MTASPPRGFPARLYTSASVNPFISRRDDAAMI
jgi:hypothetical protein